MTEGTDEVLEGHYTLPRNKVFYVPHPAYTGFYPDTVTRHEARAQLGVPHDCHVFLTFGAIQRYKGYERLIQAFEQIALKRSERKPFLIIAGKSSDPQISREIRAWALSRSDVLAVVKPIPNEDIQLFYRAADVAVCPYNATLNSGAALLAITYGKAVIGPRIGGFVDNVGPTCAWLYDPDDCGHESLLGSMEQSLTGSTLAAKSSAAAERARTLAPQSASSRFLGHLEATMREEQ